MLPIAKLDSWQAKALVLLPIFPSLLSVIGSLWIIVLAKRAPCLGTYERILVGISVSDIVHSINSVLQGVLTPSESSPLAWSFGNHASCTATGFLFQFAAFSSLLYDAALAAYYFVTIRLGRAGNRLANQMEPFFHAIAILFPLVTACVGAHLDIYRQNPLSGICWIDCRGRCSNRFLRLLFASPVITSWAVIVVCMVGIYIHVWKTVRQQNQRSSVHRIRRDSGKHKVARRRSSNGASQRASANNDTVTVVAVQSFLYAAAFAIVTVWPVFLFVYEGFVLPDVEDGSNFENFPDVDMTKMYPVLVAQAIFLPLSGFLNFFVFIRPRYLEQRRQNFSRVESLFNVLQNKEERGQLSSRTSVETECNQTAVQKISPSRRNDGVQDMPEQGLGSFKEVQNIDN